MAYGACDACGCAHHECECADRGTEIKPKRRKPGIHLVPGDWMRVKAGHRLAGAAGSVKKIDRSVKPALLTIRQLNGHELRLPLGLFEFVGYAGTEPDVL